jgi:hypothetical protein
MRRKYLLCLAPLGAFSRAVSAAPVDRADAAQAPLFENGVATMEGAIARWEGTHQGKSWPDGAAAVANRQYITVLTAQGLCAAQWMDAQKTGHTPEEMVTLGLLACPRLEAVRLRVRALLSRAHSTDLDNATQSLEQRLRSQLLQHAGLHTWGASDDTALNAPDSLWRNFRPGMSLIEVQSQLARQGISFTSGYSKVSPLLVRDEVKFGRFQGTPDFKFVDNSLNNVSISFDSYTTERPEFDDLAEALKQKYGPPKYQTSKDAMAVTGEPGSFRHNVYEGAGKHVELDDFTSLHRGAVVNMFRTVSIWSAASFASWKRYEAQEAASAQEKARTAKQRDLEDLKKDF